MMLFISLLCCYVFGAWRGYVYGKKITSKDYQERLQLLIRHHNGCDIQRIAEMHALRDKLEKFNHKKQPRENNGKFKKRV